MMKAFDMCPSIMAKNRFDRLYVAFSGFGHTRASKLYDGYFFGVFSGTPPGTLGTLV